MKGPRAVRSRKHNHDHDLIWSEMLVVEVALRNYIATGGKPRSARRARRKIRDWYAATSGERFRMPKESAR